MTLVPLINILKDAECAEWIGSWIGRGWKAIFQVEKLVNKMPVVNRLTGL
jgi:hypothetical protein